MLPLLAFLFVFGPRFQILDVHMLATTALAGVGIGALMLRGSSWTISCVFMAQIPAFSYAALASMRLGAADLAMSWIVLKWCLYLLAGYALADLYKRHRARSWEQDLTRDCCIAGVVNALFVLLVVISPAVRTLSSSLLTMEDKGHWIDTGFRGFDLSMGGGASGSIVFAVLCVLFVRTSARVRLLPLSAICASVLLIGAALTGRTGLLIAFVGLLLIAVMPRRANGENHRRSSLLTGVLLVTGVTSATVMLSEHPAAVHVREVVVPWALEGVLSDSGGVAGNKSVNAIVDDMLFLPDSDVDLIFGSGNAGRSEVLRYVPSDVGYVRLLFASGLLGLLLILGAHVPLAVLAYRMRSKSPMAFGVGFYLAVMVFANFKELHIAPRGGAALLALWSAALALRMAKDTEAEPLRVREHQSSAARGYAS